MQQQADATPRRFPPPLRMLPKVALVVWVVGLCAGLFAALVSEPLQAPRQLLSWVLLSLARTSATAEVTAVNTNWGRGGVRSYDVHYTFSSPGGVEHRHVQRILPLVPATAGRQAHAGRLDIIETFERVPASGPSVPVTYRVWHAPLLPGFSAIQPRLLGSYCYTSFLLVPFFFGTFFAFWIVGLALIGHGYLWIRGRSVAP